MKIFGIRSFVVVVLLFGFGFSFAQESNNLKGFMAGGEVSELGTATGVGLFGRYWSDYVGGDFGFGFDNTSLSFDDGAGSEVDFVDLTTFGFSAGVLAGLPVQFAKPHIRLGLGYAYSKDSVSDVKIKEFNISPSIGIDFRASEHLMVGLDLFSFTFVVSGDISDSVDSADISGYNFALFNSLRVAYLF